MSNIETAEIIQFADARISSKRLEKIIKTSTSVGEDIGDDFPTGPIFVGRRPLPEPLTETGRNFRLRQQRRDDWLRADAVREYWKVAREMDSAIHRAQQHELPEGDLHKPLAPGSCWPIIAEHRAAIMAQLLTPAPTAREIEWKRAVFKHGDHKHTDIKPERIERAIADDVEFLRTHPTRRSGKQGMDPKKLKERREWKAAFRARVALYAEQNGIDKSELAWLGWIKHRDLAAFAERYGLSYDWLLTGEGTPTN